MDEAEKTEEPERVAHPQDQDQDQDQDQEPTPFAHPQWMVGIVLILGFWAFVIGFVQPIWWWIGSPLILTLIIYVITRLIGRR